MCIIYIIQDISKNTDICKPGMCGNTAPPTFIKSNFYAGKLFAKKIVLIVGSIQKLPDNRGNVKPGINILTRLRSCLPKAGADFFEQVPPAVFAAKLFQDSCGPDGNPVFSPMPS